MCRVCIHTWAAIFSDVQFKNHLPPPCSIPWSDGPLVFGFQATSGAANTM